MGFLTVLGLILVAIILFLSVKLKWITSDNLQMLANIAGIVSLFAAALVFIIPAAEAQRKDSSELLNVTPTPQIIIKSDNFSDSESGWGAKDYYWLIYDYRDDRFYIHFNGNADSSVFAPWINAGKFSDIGIQVTVLGPFNRNNDIAKRGIGFGSQDGEKNGVFTFTINAEGKCEISQFREGEYDFLQTLLSDSIVNFDPSSSHHVLRLEVKYGEATGYIDDKVCITHILPEYKSGYVGVFATASYGGSDYVGGDSYFDDFTIYQLP